MDPHLLTTATLVAPSVLLHVVRATAFLSAVSVFGSGGPAWMARLVIGSALGTATFYAAGASPVAFGSVLELAVIAAREAAVGLLAGFVIQAVLSAVAIAGDLLAQEMGLTMARYLDAETGRHDASTTRLLDAIAMLVLFELDLHHDVLRVILATYEHAPVGVAVDLSDAILALTGTITATIALGIRLIAPVFAILLLTTVVLVVLARAVPNLNLLEFSFAFRILIALLATAWCLAPSFRVFVAELRDHLARAQFLFAG